MRNCAKSLVRLSHQIHTSAKLPILRLSIANKHNLISKLKYNFTSSSPPSNGSLSPGTIPKENI